MYIYKSIYTQIILNKHNSYEGLQLLVEQFIKNEFINFVCIIKLVMSHPTNPDI